VADLDKAGAALAVLAVEWNGNLVRFGDGKDRAPVACNGIDSDVVRHHGRRKGHVGHGGSPIRQQFAGSVFLKLRKG